MLVRPTWSVTLSCLLTAVWILVQARVEERDLQKPLSGYHAYMKQVPRFIPRLRKL
jgi:protein-S-isoprenylcysteine O-methyltransferase Ste14